MSNPLYKPKPISHWARWRHTPRTDILGWNPGYLKETHTDTGNTHKRPARIKPIETECIREKNRKMRRLITAVKGMHCLIEKKKILSLNCFLLFISFCLFSVGLSVFQAHTCTHTWPIPLSPGGVWGSGSMWKPSHRAPCQPPSGYMCVFVCRCVLPYLFTCQWPGEVQGNVCGGAFRAPKAYGLFLLKQTPCYMSSHCRHLYN